MKTTVRPDPQKATALRQMARITIERLNTTVKTAYPSNTITDYYDALHKLLDAWALEAGTRIKGDGAHQELIEHAYANRILTVQERVVLQELREYRNRIAYEGFTVTAEYLTRVEPIILRVMRRLQHSK